MPAIQNTVNLLGNENLNRTPAGRLLTWAVTYGRYIMIGTEIIVLLAFVSRFSLDRKLTDLNEEIAQRKAILEANKGLEQKIRSVHDDVKTVSAILPKSDMVSGLLFQIQSYIPSDVYLESLSISGGTLTIEAVAGTTQGFSQFLANMNAVKTLGNLEVSNVRRSQLTGTSFTLTGVVGSLSE